MTERRVAVVGAGAAGATVALRLLEKRPALEVLLIDPSESTGRGVAFSTSQPCHLLNVPAGKMSANAADPDDFIRWSGAAAGEFVPRERFGAYLSDRLDEAARCTGPASLRRLRDRVVGVRRRPGGATVTLGSTGTIDVDAVVLAVGVFAPGTGWAPAGLGAALVADPWAPGVLDEVPDDQDVLLVGTGLTMVDMATLLDRPHRVIHAVSRRGLLPRAHAVRPVPGVAPELPATCDLDSLRHAVRAHIRTCLREHRDWRPAIDGLRPHTAALWQQLTEPERLRFLAHDAPHWDVRRHRMPPATAAHVAELRRAGRLRISAGEVLAADDGVVQLTGGRELRVGAVINCTGPATRVGEIGDPLLDGLLSAGVARPGPLGIGLDTAPDGALLPVDDTAAAPLWTLGALRRGGLWESTAYPEIRQQAADVADAVLARFATQSARRRPHDEHELPLSTTPEAASAYVDALGRLLRVQSGSEAAFAAAVALDPGFALGHAALAVLSHDADAPVLAARHLHRACVAVRARGDERERSFVAAVGDLISGTDPDALLRHIAAHPRDAFAVSIAVPTIAFAGVTQGESSWELIEGLGGAYGADWWYAGQLAFVRQDQRRWDEADALSAHALALEPSSGHAVHARTHVFYETGRHDAGLAWLDGWIAERGPQANYRAHFSWHAALHELSLGDADAVRRRFVGQLAPPVVSGSRALVDSASLLWRCRVTQTWDGPMPIEAVLAACPALWLQRPPTAFAALHVAVALAAAGDVDGLGRVRRHAVDGCAPVTSERAAFARVVAPLCTALIDVVEHRWDAAAVVLGMVVPLLREVGGSAAQHEVVEDTLIHALTSAGRCDAAARVLQARLDRRESVLDRRLLTAPRG